MGAGLRGAVGAGAAAVLLAGLTAAGPGAGGPADGSLPRATAAPEGEPVRGSAPAAAQVAVVRYLSPTGPDPVVVRPFDAPTSPWSAGHRGVDLAAPSGAPVRAAAPGRVVFAGTVVDRPVVSVQHADGLRTTYEPVDPVVTAGEAVAAGDVLGHLAGAGHCVPDACLHWGARRGQRDYLDPMGLLEAAVRVRLLPQGR